MPPVPLLSCLLTAGYTPCSQPALCGRNCMHSEKPTKQITCCNTICIMHYCIMILIGPSMRLLHVSFDVSSAPTPAKLQAYQGCMKSAVHAEQLAACTMLSNHQRAIQTGMQLGTISANSMQAWSVLQAKLAVEHSAVVPFCHSLYTMR